MKKTTTVKPTVMIADTFITTPYSHREPRSLRVHSIDNGYAVCGVYNSLSNKTPRKLTVIRTDRLNAKQGFLAPAVARKLIKRIAKGKAAVAANTANPHVNSRSCW